MSPRKLFPSSGVLKKLLNAAKPDPDGLFMHNRNPRNLEMMKIAYKPYGYHLERPGRCFWHKLILNKTNKAGVTAQVLHYKNGVVLEASTNEWSLRRQLYRSYDTAAYINLGKIFAQRCLQTGLIEMSCNIEAPPGGKVDHFLKEVENCGVILSEAERYIKSHPYDQERMVKPWQIEVD